MKKSYAIFSIAAILMVAMSVTGCDYLRKLAGRPTSTDIQVIREQIKQDSINAARIAEAARLEEELARQVVADSLAAIDSFNVAGNIMRTPADHGGIVKNTLSHRYYIAVGAFRKQVNAKKVADQFDAEKYTPEVVLFKNGLNVVLVCPTDKVKDAYASYKEVKLEKACPADAWVLVNDDNWNNK